eukprot:s97_g10.t1
MGSFEEVLHNQLEELRAHLLQAHAESSVERFERERTRTWSFQKVNQGISLDALDSPLILTDARVPVEDQSEMQRMLTSVRPAEEKWASFITRMQNRNSYYVPTEKILTLHSDWISTAPGKQQGRRGATLHQSDPAIEGQPLFKGAAEDVSHMLKRGCSKLILRPQSNIRLTMSILGLIAIVWDVVFIPIQAFDDLPVAFDDFLMQITYAVFAYWFLDFLLQFVSAPETGQGVRAETRLHTVAIRYLKSWFVIDSWLSQTDPDQSSPEVPAVHRDAFHIVIRQQALQHMQSHGDCVQEAYLSARKAQDWLASAGLLGSLGKYFWYSSTWVDNADIRGREFSDQYVTSFHWSLAQTLLRQTAWSAFMLCWHLDASVLLFSHPQALWQRVNALRAVRVSTVTQEAKLRQFFSDRRLPASLLKNCLTAFREKADKTQYISEEDSVSLDCTGAIILNHGSMTYSTGELVMMPSSSVATASSASSSGSGSERARRRAAAQFMAMEISRLTARPVCTTASHPLSFPRRLYTCFTTYLHFFVVPGCDAPELGVPRPRGYCPAGRAGKPEKSLQMAGHHERRQDLLAGAVTLVKLGAKTAKDQIELWIWEVDDDLDHMVGWDEFLTMYQMCISDQTGFEPRNLFNLVQFLMYDKDFHGKISVEQTLQIIYVRHGRKYLDKEIGEIFGEEQKGSDGQELKITFSQFVAKANNRLYELRWKAKEIAYPITAKGQ